MPLQIPLPPMPRTIFIQINSHGELLIVFEAAFVNAQPFIVAVFQHKIGAEPAAKSARFSGGAVGVNARNFGVRNACLFARHIFYQYCFGGYGYAFIAAQKGTQKKPVDGAKARGKNKKSHRVLVPAAEQGRDYLAG